MDIKHTTPVVYISGLGINCNIFSKIVLKDRPVFFLEWVEPQKGENLTQYAKRLYESLELESPPIIIGLSFGGIVATEIAKAFNAEKLILISTIKTATERPGFLNILKYLPLYRLFSLELCMKTIGMWGYIFGLTEKEERQAFLQMFSNASTRYVHWAIFQIIHWKQDQLPDCPYLHLHGDMDIIFPINLIETPYIIEGGDHGMVRIKAHEVKKSIHHFIGTDKHEASNSPTQSPI